MRHPSCAIPGPTPVGRLSLSTLTTSPSSQIAQLTRCGRIQPMPIFYGCVSGANCHMSPPRAPRTLPRSPRRGFYTTSEVLPLFSPRYTGAVMIHADRPQRIETISCFQATNILRCRINTTYFRARIVAHLSLQLLRKRRSCATRLCRRCLWRLECCRYRIGYVSRLCDLLNLRLMNLSGQGPVGATNDYKAEQFLCKPCLTIWKKRKHWTM